MLKLVRDEIIQFSQVFCPKTYGLARCLHTLAIVQNGPSRSDVWQFNVGDEPGLFGWIIWFERWSGVEIQLWLGVQHP